MQNNLPLDPSAEYKDSWTGSSVRFESSARKMLIVTDTQLLGSYGKFSDRLVNGPVLVNVRRRAGPNDTVTMVFNNLEFSKWSADAGQSTSCSNRGVCIDLEQGGQDGNPPTEVFSDLPDSRIMSTAAPSVEVQPFAALSWMDLQDESSQSESRWLVSLYWVRRTRSSACFLA